MSSILPPSITPLEKALDAVAEKRLESDLIHRDVFNPWKCRADLLGILAWSLGVDDWSSEMTEQQRREACASAIRIHRQRGTVASIKQALANAGYANADITEGMPPVMFNGVTLYDGSESHASGGRWAMYRIDVDLGESNGVSASDTLRLRRILERTAPARCELVGTQYSATISDKATVTESAHAVASSKISDVRPAGRRYDGAITYSQAKDLLQNGTLLFGGQRQYAGSIVTGEQHSNAWDDSDFAAELSLGADRVAIQPNHNGMFVYSGFDYGNAKAVAADAPLTLMIDSVAISDKASVIESAFTVASPKISDVRPAGRRYDGAITYSQAKDLLQNGTLLFGGQRQYAGSIVTGEQHSNAWDDSDFAAELSLGADRVAIQPNHNGMFVYSGFDYGNARTVAAEAPLTLTLTRHRRYNGKLHHMTDAFDGSFKYNATRNYQPDITYRGEISTTESTL